MKVEVKTQKENSELPFPKLMISETGSIVLFEKIECGIFMKSIDDEELIGTYHKDFCMGVFTDFKGSITITQ